MFSAQTYVSRSTPYRVLLRIGLAAVVVLGLGANAIAQSGDDGVCSVVAVPGAMYTTAEGVNSSGTVVGSYFTPEIGAFGYIYSNGQFTTLTAPDSLWTVAHGINDAGVVVGAFLPATPVCNCVDDIEARGFTYVNGAFTVFDIGRSQTHPLAINNAGTIVGYYHDRDGDIEDAPRGFLLSAGGLTRIDAPGGGPLTDIHTYVRGINDNGVAVGSWSGDAGGSGFTWQNGVMTMVRHPESPERTSLNGIANDGTIVGTTTPNAGEGESFRFADNRFSKFDCFEPTEEAPPPAPDPESPPSGPSPGALLLQASGGKAFASAVSNRSAVVGTRWVNGTARGFYTRPVVFVDPIPDPVRPGDMTIPSDKETLATKGRIVYGIAADGAAQIVVRIPVANANETVTVSVYRNKTQAANDSETNAYGAVWAPGQTCPGTNCDKASVEVTSGMTSTGPMAFAVYRAPADFPRTTADSNLQYRDVYLRVQGAAGSTTISLRVIRPVVLLVHGIWSSEAMWRNFYPYRNGDSRFRFYPIDYGLPMKGMLLSTVPSYWSWGSNPLTSSLGIDYNAKKALPVIFTRIDWFKSGQNPTGLPVAAIRADFVVHSMGGVITRYLPKVDGFNHRTMGYGVVHKLVTIDTPHTGSPLANRFMDQIPNVTGCLRGILRLGGSLVIKQARLTTGTVNGAAFDLQQNRGGITQEIATQTVRPIPTGLIAGIYTQWGSLDFPLGPAKAIHGLCGIGANDDIALSLTGTGWPTLMGDQNDAMVTLSSQKAGIQGAGHVLFTGFAHSDALLLLGFDPPYVTNHPAIADTVLDILNTPYTDSNRYTCLPAGQSCGQQQ